MLIRWNFTHPALLIAKRWQMLLEIEVVQQGEQLAPLTLMGQLDHVPTAQINLDLSLKTVDWKLRGDKCCHGGNQTNTCQLNAIIAIQSYHVGVAVG